NSPYLIHGNFPSIVMSDFEIPFPFEKLAICPSITLFHSSLKSLNRRRGAEDVFIFTSRISSILKTAYQFPTPYNILQSPYQFLPFPYSAFSVLLKRRRGRFLPQLQMCRRSAECSG